MTYQTHTPFQRVLGAKSGRIHLIYFYLSKSQKFCPWRSSSAPFSRCKWSQDSFFIPPSFKILDFGHLNPQSLIIWPHICVLVVVVLYYETVIWALFCPLAVTQMLKICYISRNIRVVVMIFGNVNNLLCDVPEK